MAIQVAQDLKKAFLVDLSVGDIFGRFFFATIFEEQLISLLRDRSSQTTDGEREN